MHPFLISIAPVVFLFSRNVHQLTLLTALLPLVFSVLLTGLMLAVLRLIRKDYSKAAIFTSVIMIAFFSFGHIFGFLWDFGIFYQMTLLYILLLLLFALVIIWIGINVWRTQKNLEQASTFLFVVPCFMILFSLFSMLWKEEVKPKIIAKAKKESTVQLESRWKQDQELIESIKDREEYPKREPILKDSASLPDIYYIILDGYTRADTLKAIYGFDNSDFINALEERGFYVPDLSLSNYSTTFLSLASSMNMRYVNDMVGKLGPERRWRLPFYNMIRNPKVVRFLKSKGYRYVHFNTGWGATEKSDIADVSYSYTIPLLHSEFFNTLIRTTVLRLFEPSVAKAHLFKFEKLREIPHLKGPTFTLAHFLLPHNPYVFDRDGNIRHNIPLDLQFKKKTGGWRAKDAYIDQLIFTNKMALELVDYIIDQSPFRPIVVLQADHGAASTRNLVVPDSIKHRERLSILNAYYVTEKCKDELYPSITPVNTFRLILKSYFDENYEKLPDRVFYSWYERPFDLIEATEEVKNSYPPRLKPRLK